MHTATRKGSVKVYSKTMKSHYFGYRNFTFRNLPGKTLAEVDIQTFAQVFTGVLFVVTQYWKWMTCSSIEINKSVALPRMKYLVQQFKRLYWTLNITVSLSAGCSDWVAKVNRQVNATHTRGQSAILLLRRNKIHTWLK